jgi:hypothetical protein
MEDSERPEFGASYWAQIEAARNGVDRHFWQILRAFLVSPIPRLTWEEFAAREPGSAPPEAKRPEALRMTIEEYAENLFAAEGQLYPDDPQLHLWYDKLRERIANQVVNGIKELEAANAPRSLAHHGLKKDEMRRAALNAVDRHIRARLNPPPFPPPKTGDEPRALENLSTVPGKELKSLVVHRRELLAEYKQATGNPPDQRIYTAANSGIYKPQFYQWRDGRLPAKSKISRRFEAFLRARRKPIPRQTA